jgi:predicted kinase
VFVHTGRKYVTGGAVLVVISGLPATGKSSVSRIVAAELSAPYVRIDTLERALARAGAAGVADGTLGYVVGYAIAEDLLRYLLSRLTH